MIATSHNALPHPAELDRRRGPSLARRARAWAKALRHNRPARFAAVFVSFVAAGTLMINLLEGRQQGSPFADLFNDFWFTMVTVTTTGFGDMSPKLTGGRLWTIVEMFVGVTLVGIITGSIASALVEGNRRRALGLAQLGRIRDHIVVCGWKRDMRNILLGILEADLRLSSWDLVLVTTHPASEIIDLRRERGLLGLQYIYGSPTDRIVLEMAHVKDAQRVIILADESGRRAGSDPDARTVLAATAVEAISGEVYTCTELIRPHYVEYLRPAGVEEVVLEADNARALIVAASLGDGLANVVTRLLPEQGRQLRVLWIPSAHVGAPYRALERAARARGYLPVGLLETTGSLYDRRQEHIAEARHVTDYGQAVAKLRSAANLVSNVPVLAPRMERTVPPHSKLLVMLPAQTVRAAESPVGAPPAKAAPNTARPERLVICGWKRGMAALLLAILDRHAAAGRPLAGLGVAAQLPPAEAEEIARDPRLAQVRLALGEPTDPAILRQAGIVEARRALILADPAAERGNQENDARNVMAGFAVNELNPRAYKCVELDNASFEEHLRAANVEEPVYTAQYQRLMLVQASLGTGLAGAVGALFDPAAARLRVVDFDLAPPDANFGEHAESLARRGLLLAGVLEDAGDSLQHKLHHAREAQAQARTREAVELLLRLKQVHPNTPLIHPGDVYRPGGHARALVITQDAPAETQAEAST